MEIVFLFYCILLGVVYNDGTRKKSLVGRVRKTPVGHGVDAVTNDEKRSRHPAIYGRTRVLLGKNDLAPTRDFLL